ncbi:MULTISPECIES: NUDIX domain-containing protein [Streptomyces]|uniref:Putative NUDIX hydrolase n=1 Tax=Streptomyces scabiei (strain 87.22) TaxID=680198 RepID=C9YXT2_STRSW|nr:MULTISPECIES: NUDIX domain-containing protein [Streptomyces]MBP5861859.1 NUDIX domain-containing protein [Streptomyces sp. LBUM 1484]MBP5869194.1 NUDIX domain-containing protein [Streptomyces sp. LBUM 1485]MBP5907665.1 NUDIX domain-containing protein [Streptomyces sp. LBUM 1478]MBP5929415.1 NUDIX domain-containing protein [Streptomyces sp. LBUM 1479]KFG09752.1 NUDIX hydrolase [Streptomyces scabiei]
MRWTVHGEHVIHDTPWVRLRSLDVEQPDGTRGDYHVVRLRDLAVTAAVDARRRVLMMWRHRFVTDTWAWELPMGLVEDGERPEEAAARELEEETGWRPGSLRELAYAEPAAGVTDTRHFVFRTDDARRVGEPTERNESDRLEWIALADVPGLITRREIVSSATLVGVMALLLESPGTGFDARP